MTGRIDELYVAPQDTTCYTVRENFEGIHDCAVGYAPGISVGYGNDPVPTSGPMPGYTSPATDMEQVGLPLLGLAFLHEPMTACDSFTPAQSCHAPLCSSL